MAASLITSWQIEGEKVEVVTDFLSLVLKSLWTMTAAMKSEDDCFFWWQESYDKPRQCVEKQRHYSANKGPYSQGYGFSSSHVWMWELHYKESWVWKAFKLWCWGRLLRNLHSSQEATVRTGHGTKDWFQIGKGVCQGSFNLYADYIMRNAGLEEAQTGIKISGRNVNNLRYSDDNTLMTESEEELKSLLMKVKEESEKTA